MMHAQPLRSHDQILLCVGGRYLQPIYILLGHLVTVTSYTVTPTENDHPPTTIVYRFICNYVRR